MKNTKKFNEFMAALSTQIDKTFDQGFIRLVRKAVEPFPDEDCIKAFNYIIPRCQFQSDITTKLLEELEKSGEAKALLAWILVEKTIRGIGNYESVQFDDPVIHGVIESLGGWSDYSDFNNEKLVWKQREFINRYKVLERKTHGHPEYLPGRVEIDNNARNFLEKIEVKRIAIKDKTRKLRLEKGDT